MSLPSKLTSYFASGQPVLAAVSVDGACAAELQRAAGAAARVEPGDPSAVVAAVRDLRADPARLRLMGRRASSYARRSLGRDSAGERICRFVTELLATPRTR